MLNSSTLKYFLIFIFLFCSVNAAALEGDCYYPLVVFGGEPEGVSAAVAAAREGVKTLLIMERDTAGGLMTYGGLNYLDLNYGPDGKNLNKGLFAEWHRKVGGKVTFSIDKATEVFQDMLAVEPNLMVYPNTRLEKIIRDDNKITAIEVVKDGELKVIEVGKVIDASQDADLAVKAGVPYFLGGEDIGLTDRHMAVTLVLHIGNVDWQGLQKDVRSWRYGPSYSNKDHAWGFVKIGQLYQPQNKKIKLRGLNIVIEDRAEKAEVYINSMLIFDVEPTDKDSLKEAHFMGQEEAVHVLNFLKENLGGFAEAELLDFPAELYVRESRHILAEYQLRVEDLLANKIFIDTIALASYPLDYQAATAEYDGFVLFNPEFYGVPLRSLIPVGLKNLLVVGRSSGYSSLAAASARVLPTGMSAAEAAGIAAAISLNGDVDFRDICNDPDLMEEIQFKVKIKEQKVSLALRKDKPIINDEVLLPYFEELLSWGLVIGGYENDFKLEETITEREFAHMIVKGLKAREAPILYEWVPGGLETMSSLEPLKRDQAAMLLLVAISRRISEIEPADYYSTAQEYDLIPEIIKEEVLDNRLLTRREAYIILSSFLQKYPTPFRLKIIRGEFVEE